MSVSRQLITSVIIVLLATGGWYIFSIRDDILLGSPEASSGESVGKSGGRRGGQAGGGPRRGGVVPVVTAQVALIVAALKFVQSERSLRPRR